MNVLVLNSGSSTLKFQLIATDFGRIAQNRDEHLCRGLIERIGGEAIITVQTRNGLKAEVYSFTFRYFGIVAIPGAVDRV